MKKQLLALALLGSGLAQSQVWTEDFSSVTTPGLPAGWMQNNVDGLTVAGGLSTYNFGTNAWVTRDMIATFPANGKVAASTSWYSPVGTSNDWLITPSFTVPANAVIEWDAMALDAFYLDGYQVKVSNTSTAVASFTNVLTVGAENATWTNRSVNLNAYAGQTVYIAFVNNSNDKYILFLDNINVKVPQANDGNVQSITGLPRYKAGAGNQNITGSFKSNGFSPVNTAVLNYNVNNGAVVTETITFGTPLNYGQSAAYNFTAPANLPLGVNKVKTWVTHVNGISEVNLVNDSAYTVVYIASQSVSRKALIEEWSSSTCGPCAYLNVQLGFDALINSNNANTGADLNIIKYQVNWPSPGNDPSYNAHCLARRMHYDVNAAPTTIINGTTEMQNHSQAEIDAAKLEPAFANITPTLSAKGSTNAAAATTIVASATITPFVTIPTNSPLRVYQAIIQSDYMYAASSTSQDAFYHVMRKMDANGWGVSTTVTDGTPFVVNFSHNASAVAVDPTTPAQMTFNSWTSNPNSPATPKDIVYEYVVFLQDTISNDILQSASWTASVSVPAPTVSTVGVKELTNINQVSIFPNPAKEYATVSITLEKASSVGVSIFDITGKQVYTNAETTLDSGTHNMTLNTSEFASGTYVVEIKANGATLKEKLLISK